LSFHSGQKLLNCLGYFDPHNLTAEISAFKDEDEIATFKRDMSIVVNTEY
jgi:hypothetical protein